MNFESLMQRADTLLRFESDSLRSEWWIGHMYGLRRAHHGDRFGSAAEHERRFSYAESTDPLRAAHGRGYRAGLKLSLCDPD